MVIVASEVGIDVASAELVTSIDEGKPFASENTKEGAIQLAKVLPAGSTIHVESTGGYERTAVRVLREAGFKVDVHNPLNVLQLARGSGRRAKTDPLDARTLSRVGQQAPASQCRSQERQALTDLSRAIDTVKVTIGEYKKRRNMPGLDQAAVNVYSGVIDELEARAKDLEADFVKRVKDSPCWSDYKLVRSIDCVGPVTARVCICELPENVKTQPTPHAASYAGVAPIDRSSGKRKKAYISHGNRRLKKGLYMAAVTSVRSDEGAKTLYARLRASGKTHEQAIVPVMHRLLRRVVCVLKRGSSWQDEPPKP